MSPLAIVGLVGLASLGGVLAAVNGYSKAYSP